MNQIRIRSFRPAQLSEWMSCGWRLGRRRPLEALRPAAAFALAVPVLRLVPVIGDITLLLLLPTVLASYLLYIHLSVVAGRVPHRGRGGSPDLRRLGRELRQALLGAWAKRENIFPLVVVGLVLVVLGLVIHLLFNLVAGPAAASPYEFTELAATQQIRLLLGYALAVLWWLGIMMLLLWTLPLFVLRDLALTDALAWNARALAGNAAVVLLLLGVMAAAAFVPALLLRPWSIPAQLGVQWLSLALVAALFGLSSYCSYRLVFADVAPPAPPAPPRS